MINFTKLLLLIYFFIGIIHSVLQAQEKEEYGWKNVEILGGGFVSGVIYNRSEQGLLYARTDVGGAYRWEEAEKQWVPLTDHLGRDQQNYTGILSLATDPTDPDRLYLAAGLYTRSWAGYGAILISEDRGENWTTVSLDQASGYGIKLGGNEDGRSTGERLQVDPNQNNILFMGTSTQGLWKSTDYAASWTKVASFPVESSPEASGGLSFVLFDESSAEAGNASQTIYVGVLRTGDNLYKSTDGGDSWEVVSGGPENLMPHQAALASEGGTLYVTYSDSPGPNGISSGSVRKLNTATGEWTTIDPPSGQGGYAGLSVDPGDPNTLLVSTLNRWWPHDQVFRSTDGGGSWEGLVNVERLDHSLAPYTEASNPHWIGDVEMDPFNPDNAWFITGYGLWASYNAAGVNNEVSWVFDNKGLEETVPLELASPPAGAPLVSALGDIDGFRHVNLDQSPEAGRLNPRYGTNRSIDFAEKKPAFMVRTHDNSGGKFGAFSEDGGESWKPFGSAPAGTSLGGQIAISADGATIVWSPQGAATHYSTDKGSSWKASSGLRASVKPVADRVNPSKFYAYDALNGQGNLYVSTDGGASFSVAATGLPTVYDWELYRAAIQTVFGKEGHLWLASPQGLFRSTDSGGSFERVQEQAISEALRVGFGKAKGKNPYPAIYIAGTIAGETGFFRSDDEGESWLRINDDQQQFGGINDITGDPRTFGRLYIATGGRGILYGEPLADCSGTAGGTAFYDFCGDCVGGDTGLEACAVAEQDCNGDAGGTAFLDDCNECVGGNTGKEACEPEPTGFGEEEEVNTRFYPNPFTTALYLQAEKATSYTITSLTGWQLETGHCKGDCYIGAGLAKGVYVLILANGESRKAFKIIKQ